MYVYAYPKGKVNQISPKSNYVVVSIGTPGDDKVNIRNNVYLLDTLRVEFDDVSYGSADERVNFPINEKIANEIAGFVLKYKDKVNDIVIHCDAGMSRSVGVALGIGKFFETEEKVYSLNGISYANLLCKDLVYEALSSSKSDR